MWACTMSRKAVKMAKISLKEWCRKNNANYANATRKANSGQLQTAEKIGGKWYIDEKEKPVDTRVKTGRYKNIHKRYYKPVGKQKKSG